MRGVTESTDCSHSSNIIWHYKQLFYHPARPHVRFVICIPIHCVLSMQSKMYADEMELLLVLADSPVYIQFRVLVRYVSPNIPQMPIQQLNKKYSQHILKLFIYLANINQIYTEHVDIDTLHIGHLCKRKCHIRGFNECYVPLAEIVPHSSIAM